jgi:hypothetical protein
MNAEGSEGFQIARRLPMVKDQQLLILLGLQTAIRE